MTRTRRDFIEGCLAASSLMAVGLPACNLPWGGCGKAAGKPEGGEDEVRVTDGGPGASGTRDYTPAWTNLGDDELKARGDTLWEMLEACELCPRACGVNRLAGENGVCELDYRIKVASAFPHFGEEKELVGRRGSGTVFFSHCNLLCSYCQNWELNHRGDGRFITPDELARVMLRLQDQGCHNINLVTPTHVNPQIMVTLPLARKLGLRLPLVYNTGGYDKVEVLQLLDGVVDIYMPDCKYQDQDTAARLSAGARDYPEVAARAIEEMNRQVGVLQVTDGLATRGLVVRHLVLPDNLAGTDRFVKWVVTSLGRDTFVNIMAQYRPQHEAWRHPDINRRTNRREMTQALGWAKEAGLRGY